MEIYSKKKKTSKKKICGQDKGKTNFRFFASPEAMKKAGSFKKLFSFWKSPKDKDLECAKTEDAPEKKFQLASTKKLGAEFEKNTSSIKKKPLQEKPSGRLLHFIFGFLFEILKSFYLILFFSAKIIKNIFWKGIEKYKNLCEKIKPKFLPVFLRRHYPLFLAIVFLTPAFFLLFLFVNSQLYKQSSYAANFTGAVRVSKQSTTLSTAGGWYKSMAYSGDGVNGDAEAGNFNPIHPGGTTDGSAGGLAVGYVAQAATATYAAAQFIGFKPDQTGNLAGVQLVIENLTATSLANSDIVVELLQFPSATCTTSCSNYVTGTQGAYDYPNDTVVLRRTVWQHNQGLSGENIQPGNHGRATFDFRFDTPVAVTAGGGAGNHYGIRVINMGASAPVFGTWAQAPIANGFPTIDGTIRTIGVKDIYLTSAPTMTMPEVLTGNTILTTNPMVAGNSVAGVGMATMRRTENEHWTATYSGANANWTLAGSVSGTQTNKLTTATDGGTGASWVNDGVTKTTLTADTTTATTRFCVASISGFAANQYFDVWDSNTASAQFTIASVNATDVNCPSNGPSIISTAAMVVNTHNYNVAKNATIARATWKQRIVQGAVAPFSMNMPDTTHICVASGWGSKFAVNTAGTGANIAVWDDDHAIATNTVTLIENGHAACSGGDRLTVTAITAGTYITTKNAYVAEISATISNTGTPADGAIAKYTTINHTQNPTGSALLARTTSVAIAYAKTEAVATSNTRYPFLSNRHIFFVAYGDADTSAPADGDIVIVGNGKADPDSGDAAGLTNDLNWSGKQSHVVTIDRNWNAPMAYTGYNGSAINDGAGSRTDFSAWSQNGGWVSALVTPGSQLGLDNSPNKHYRITIPGKIVVDSDASVALGTSSAAIPSTSGHDVYFDTVSPDASTALTDVTVNGNATTLNVTSATGFAVGDWIVLDDNDSVPTARVIAAIQSGTQITLVAGGAATPVYTSAQSSFIAKGPATELPTGQDRRAGIYTMTGVVTSTQSNLRTGRVSLYADGSEDFRTEKSDLAVDIDGNIDTGYLGNNLTDSGNTWVDVKNNVVGDWQPLDQISVAGGTNQLADNDFSSPGMGGTDDANQFPVWTGAVTKSDTGAGGRNALPTPNMEVAEIGTIPMTNIYNSDYNGGSPLYSSNYNNTSVWTIFGDSANTETNDAVYFGDQGSNMPYALEFNLGTAMNASANYVWEYYKSGVGWTAFTPRDAYQYANRTGVTLPLSANTVNNSLTITLAEGGTVFGPDQIVMIDDNNSDPIYRRLTASAAGTLTFSEPVPSGYDTANAATVTRLNGGQWQSMDPTAIFTSGTGRRIVSWTPSNLNGTPAKTTINGVNAYWVRARISSFTSWTTSPTNQTTPVGMGGVERMGSGVFNVSSGTQEAKVSEITPGSSFDPNENYILEYGNSPGWTQLSPLLPAAPYTWHVNNGMLSQNTATADFHASNGDFSWGNYTVTAKVRMRTTTDATSRKIGIVLRDSLDGNGYGALIEKTTTGPQQRIGIYPMTLGAEGAAYSNFTKAFTDNSWYWIKANVTGTGAATIISAKFWADGSGEPGSWDTTYTTTAGQGLWNTGRIGLYADAMIADFDDVSVDNGSVVLSDSFTSADIWKLRGSINGDLGTVTPGTPFASNYLNFTLKQKGGWNGTVNPEIGDKIYISPTSTRSYKGLSGTGTSAITTSDANTVYENVNFEWNPTASNYNVTGSATGALGTATPGSAYTAAGGKIGMTIPTGAPTATKFGDRMLLLQDNFRRNTGSWIGSNGQGSSVLIWPTYTLTSSAIATRYNSEGQSGTATARQRGTIDFWFKTNYAGAPSASTHPKGMYLYDQANQTLTTPNTDRIFVRHTPDGYLEAGVFGGTTQNTLLRKSFSATAGEWHHFRLAWNDSDGGAIASKKKAWLDGAAFTVGEGQDTAVGARGANTGVMRIGNVWTYDAPFDGSIDEFAVFDDAIDTSGSCDWGAMTPPVSTWTNGSAVGCDDADSDQGTNLFRASFDRAMNPQEGSILADYAFGNPAMVFTNGADTGNERIRIVTYPARTRVWVDNTGEKYTPSARIKFGSGFQENATAATLAGWSHNFTFHHKAARQSTASPTYSPVLNLKRSTHIWSVEPITQAGATMGAPINAGLGYSNGTIGLSGLGTINFSDVSMENQYANFAVLTNPYTSLAVKPTQTIANSVFYNYYDRAYTVAGKTQGSNKVGAYFVTTHVGAGNIGAGYNVGTSQNVGIDGSIFMGHRNQYVGAPPAAAGGAVTFYSGRLYSVLNSEFYNNGITGLGTSGALNLGTGVAKVDIKNDIFSINTQGLRLYGNAFINMENNIFEGHVSDSVTTASNEYGAGIRANPSYSTVGVTDKNSVFGRGLWNEADISLPPNTTTFEAESLLQFIGEGTQLRSPILFGTQDYNNMNRIGDEYLTKTIPGLDIRGTYSANNKDIVNLTTLGLMRTTGTGLTDTTVRTSGGYGWRMEPTDPDVPLDYSVKLVGVANKPLAATGYIRINSNYGSTNLPTVSLSGLGMTGANLTWTAQPTADNWQQFVVSGTPTESALAELKISGKLDYITADSGTSELISNATGNYLPALLEDNDKAWTPNQWVGYKLRDANGKVFEIVKNTDKLLYLKGMVVPQLLSTTFAALTPGDYIIYNEPYLYLDDVSVLSGSVDTGTLDFHSQGQPVSPWLATGLTAEGVWNAQFSTFADSEGSFGQLLGDSLIAKYANISDSSPTVTEFDTNLDSLENDFYNNGVIVFTEGSNKGVVRRIADYAGASKTITVDPALPFAPNNDNRFAIIAATASASGSGGGSTAAEIWTYMSRTLTDATLDEGSLATAADVANIRSDITLVLTQLGTGNIAAIKTATDSIDWNDVTGLVTTAGQIKGKTDTIAWGDVTGLVTTAGQIKGKTDTIAWGDVTGLVTTAGQIKGKTDTIDWTDISAIQTKTGTIAWGDVTGLVTTSGQIKGKTDTIDWTDISAIKAKTDDIDWTDISAIQTKTGTINWSDVSGIVTTSGQIKDKTDTIDWGDVAGIVAATSTIDWTDISAIQTKTGTINWSDVTGIQAKTNTIDWGDITAIKGNVATLITEIGTSNISAIKTATETINWSNITGLVTTAGEIKGKTDNINWNDISAIQTKTGTINWDDVTGIQAKTDTIAWGDIATLQSSVDALNDISASDIWNYATRTITGEVTLTSDSRKAIWDSACAILNSSGSVGKLICDNLDAKVSEAGGSTLTAEDVWNYATRTITGLGGPALSAIANSVWSNATKTLTSYGNDITAQNVWDVMTSSLTTIDSIGELLVVNVDDTISSRASQSSLNDVSSNVSDIKSSVEAMASNLATVLSEIGTGNISAIKTKTDSISWSDITGLITTSGEIKNKTDNINWTDIGAIKTATDTIDWDDITTIKLKTNTIEWGDIANIKSNVATLISEIGVGNISAIKAGTDTIKWSDITGLVTTSGQIKDKTDTIDWNKIDTIKTKTDTIDWDDVTGIKLKTSTINWSDVSDIKTNTDVPTSTRASQESVDDVAANVDVPVSTRASQESVDTFSENTANSLSDISSNVETLTVNVAAIQGDLSTIESKIDDISSALNSVDEKIDTVDSNVDSIKTSVENASVNVAAIQTVTNNILNKWGGYSATDIVGYVDALENYVGDPADGPDEDTLFGKISSVKETAGSGGIVDQIYAQVQTTHDKLLDVQAELGFNGKSTSAYDEILAVKTYVDTVENNMLSLDSKTSNISSSVSNVSNDLKDVTDQIGRVSSDSLAQNLEVKKTDIDYLKNKIIELKAVADINRQLLEKTVNQPVVKVLMEWGSVVIKFIIVNPADSTDQKIPFKAFLPKEVKQEYIMDLGGLSLNYDATTEQYYVTTDIALKPGESVTRSVEIKDIWIISQDEIDSTKKQAEEMAAGLSNTSYNAQAITLKTDINTRLDKIMRKQKDSNATPQDHILAYRENQEELKAVNENMKGIKDLVLNSGNGKSLLASIGGIQTFATWGIVLALIFGMGALGFFYYALWRKRILTYRGTDKKEKNKNNSGGTSNKVQGRGTNLSQESKELPLPPPWHLPGLNLSWLKKLIVGIFVLAGRILWFAGTILKKIAMKTARLPKKALLSIGLIIIIFLAVLAVWKYEAHKKESLKEEENRPSISSLPTLEVENPPIEEPSDKEKKVTEAVDSINKKAEEKAKSSQEIEDMLKEGSAPAETVSGNETEKTASDSQEKKMLSVKETPTGWLNVREEPSTNGALVTKVYPNEEYAYSETKDGWYKITLKDGKEGWVIGEYVNDGNLSQLEGNTSDEKEQKVLGASTGEENLVVVRPSNLPFVNVYGNPTYAETVIGRVYPGAMYHSFENQNGWFKITFGEGKEGWILEEYLRIENRENGNPTNYVKIVPIDGSFINIREEPGVWSGIVRKVYLENRFPKLEEKDGWVKIELLDGSQGWVSSQFAR
jgi:uncharacterized protein YgiM (DUF1202 family)